MEKYQLRVIRVLLWNLLPVILIHSVFRFFWDEKGGSDLTSLTLFEMSFTMVIIPLYLLLINYRWMDRTWNQIAIGLLMSFVILLSSFLHFSNWADTVGSWNPDRETVAVFQLQFFIGLGVTAIGTLIIVLSRFPKTKLPA